jgi:hypothetical protein
LKAAVIAMLFGIGRKPDKEDLEAEILAKELEKELDALPQNMLYEALGLDVFGRFGYALMDGVVDRLQGRTFVNKQDVQTGIVYTDLFLDVQDATEKMAVAIGDYMDGETYVSGAKKGEPKWETTVPKAIDATAEIVMALSGLPYSGIKSDVVYPYKGAVSAIDKTLTTEQILVKIRDNTYRTSGKGADGTYHKAGSPHRGREELVADLKKEYARRKGKATAVSKGK